MVQNIIVYTIVVVCAVVVVRSIVRTLRGKSTGCDYCDRCKKK
jgi:hypothetical protein